MKKQSSCPSALNREETGYSAQIGPDFFIREATLADAAIIWQTIYDNRVYLRTWLPFVDGLKEVADEEAFLNEQLALPYADRNIVFVIGQGHELCGLVGFVITDNINHRTEIGYWLIPEYQGRGIMTRCVRHLCEWAVSELGMNSIRIRCAAGNAPSNAIPRRLGFTLEGVEREGELMADGQYVDLNVYSILKREIENW
ncbi:MAG: GNAT family N-acetyltransferase [Odoribacter splanchnicus]|nr:GNAT family protein [Odoribacter splanchnicus]MBS6593976.1 GNAT family N-acetyltransferase [Odoribacter splanchnicus]